VDGSDIVVSIDINVQRIAEEQIVAGVSKYKADSGSVMVTDPKTGEILAACSTPLFNLSDMSVVEPGATSLRAVSDSYEPGSIFKIVTAGIALDQSEVKDKDQWLVPAYYLVGNNYVSDDDGRNWDMDMSLREILRRSSNAGAALVAQEVIGQNDFVAGMKAFGIGTKTGIDYPGEVEGIVKEASEFDGSTLGTMGFGQALAVPAVQMVRAAGAVANGGVAMTPHFLVSVDMEKKEWPKGTRVMSKRNATLLTDMLCDVIEEGTGTLAPVPGHRIAGKTGTAQQADLEKGGYKLGSFSSSLLGYGPAEDPKVLVYVGLNGTDYHSTDSSAPLFSAIMSEALTDMSIMPTESE
jgi:cell division protein FtsI (penicillin-binding protein 3)